MIPIGYMAKRVQKRPDWLKANHVIDIFSVSGCVSDDFADYINYWKHNGYWLFDSPEIISGIAKENLIHMDGTSLFYYEAYEMEFDGENWGPFAADLSFPTNVLPPFNKRLEGFDVVNFTVRTSPECSPLSCNRLAGELRTNAHCLFDSFDEAKMHVSSGAFNKSEPAPYRIFSVYSVEWLSLSY